MSLLFTSNCSQNLLAPCWYLQVSIPKWAAPNVRFLLGYFYTVHIWAGKVQGPEFTPSHKYYLQALREALCLPNSFCKQDKNESAYSLLWVLSGLLWGLNKTLPMRYTYGSQTKPNPNKRTLNKGNWWPDILFKKSPLHVMIRILYSN